MKVTSSRRARAVRMRHLSLLFVALAACGSNRDAADRMRSRPSPAQDARDASEIEAPPMHAAANDARVRAPMDATPSPDGERVFYTALLRNSDVEDAPGVFQVPADGGDIQELAVGGLLTAPVGISIGLDGRRLYVADAAVPASPTGPGAILTLSSEGGAPAVVAGTAGFEPRGVAIARVDAREWLYFTGRDPESGRAGVFRVAPEGGHAEAVARDVELVDPAGLAVAGNGDVYAVDALASQGLAGVVRIREGRGEAILDGIGVGFPAGIALSRDGATVLVSGLDALTRRDRVYVIDAESLALAFISEPFETFSEPAGLHRAHDTDVFAWADSEANDSGTVYVLTL